MILASPKRPAACSVRITFNEFACTRRSIDFRQNSYLASKGFENGDEMGRQASCLYDGPSFLAASITRHSNRLRAPGGWADHASGEERRHPQFDKASSPYSNTSGRASFFQARRRRIVCRLGPGRSRRATRRPARRRPHLQFMASHLGAISSHQDFPVRRSEFPSHARGQRNNSPLRLGR